MNYLEAVLLAKSRQKGRAQRSALFRHRHIVKRPLGLVLWQLGAEPFTAAAVAWGFRPSDRNLVVPGEPRDRELAFRALMEVGHNFNRWFEGQHGAEAPQVVVLNRGTLRLLGRLARRLAYLPVAGPRPADPALVRFGWHLRFLSDRARFPGQQLVLVLTDLLASHWITELSELEAQNLAALDAAIDPPRNSSAYRAAFAAEQVEIGPAPTAKDDERVDSLVAAFNAARDRSTDESIVAPLRQPIRAHYQPRIFGRGWPLLWKCLQRERGFEEAPHVKRRWQEDIAAFERHLEWVTVRGGRYRTRDTHARAAITLRSWEEAQRLLLAEEAIDDAIRMIPWFLSNEAIGGTVMSDEPEHREQPRRALVLRPRLTVETVEPCHVPTGTKLYWTKMPSGREYVVVSAKGTRNGGSLVTLQLETGAASARPKVGDKVVFSVNHFHPQPFLRLPAKPPWTHTAAAAGAAIEEPADAGGWE